MAEIRQVSLFDIPRSRASDPHTSKLAERDLVSSGLQNFQSEMVLETVSEHPGGTAREYDSMPGAGHGAFHRRLVELERKGLVRRGEARRCRIGNKQAATWYPV